MKKLLFLFLLIPVISQAITPVFCCGFECGLFGVVGQHWSSSSNSSMQTSIVRSGARALRMNPTGATGANDQIALTGSNYIIARFAIRFTTLPTLGMSLMSSIQQTPGVWFEESDNKIYAGAQLDVYGATGFEITTGVWYVIDLHIDADSNPWTIDVSVNGTALGQVTRALAATSLTGVRLGYASSRTYDGYWDDVVVSNTQADFPIGDGKVEHFVPTADATHNIAGTNDFERTLTGTDILNATTDAYQLIDDIPLESSVVDFINMIAPPNATDYTEHLFGAAPGVNTPQVAPRGVEVILAIHQAGTTTGNMEIRLNDNGTTGVVYTATAVAGTTTLLYKRAHFADPPSAASVWTLSGDGNFNNLKVRFGSPAALDVNPDQYLDCIMVEAEFPADVYTVPGTPGDKRFTNLGVGLINPKK